MVSPSFIGIALPAGVHQVSAVYVATPIKTPLVILAVIVVIGLLVFRRRIDRIGKDPEAS